MARRKRGASPRSRREERTAGFQQLPVQQFRNPYPPMALLDEEQLAAIHACSLRILGEIGVNFLLEEARERLRKAGAEVDPASTRVRFDPAMVEELVALAPSHFDLHARNPRHTIRLGGNHINFGAVSSPPNCSDLEGGRRSGSFEDYVNFLKLTQSINVAQAVSGHAVEPVDVPTPVRHLVATEAMIRFTDKPFKLYPLGRQRVLDVMEMVKLTFDVDDEELCRAPRVFTNVNANSPLQYDVPMLWGMIECGLRSQPVIITPFTLAGAMAPVTLAGALAQQNAEALAGVAFMQIVQPGCPCVYGGYTSNVDMRSGSPAFGTPENVKATLIGGQLARRYGLPYRSSNNNASNAPDVQATYESMMSLWAVVMSHTNYVNHALGWLEGGLCASFEKFIIDAEMIQHLCEFMRPVPVTDADLAFDAIRDVGPGGHFFGTPHTIERFENAFYAPFLSDWSNFENWSDAGSRQTVERANAVYRSLLADYDAPPLDEAVAEALGAFVRRRSDEGGAPMQ
jgi:trimethylamine--corrinoid protein Co-methyltransferase